MSKEKVKVEMDPKYIIKLTVTLFCTCVVVAGLLGGVNAITSAKIAEINWNNTVEAMKNVVPDKNSEFSSALENTPAMADAAVAGGATLDAVYEITSGGQSAGYAVKVVASGSQGNIEMVVGIDADGAVTGVSIVNNSETAGIGSKVMSNEPLSSGTGVLDQFKEMTAADAPLTVGGNVQAITGATVSSRGVTAGVNAALAVAGAIG